MFHDARRIEPGARIHADICVVGAGAAGIAIARELIGSGLQVCVLESGGVGKDGNAQALAGGESIGHPYFPLVETRQRRFGGTTGWWAGECRPLDNLEDLAPRPWLGHPGWPIEATDLSAYEERARAVCGLSARSFEPAEAWFREAGVPPLALDTRCFVTRIFQYAMPTDFAKAYGKALGAATDIEVLMNATCVSVETTSPRRVVTGVRALTDPGREIKVIAGTVILATGGIENARLLLASTGASPNGLGNDHNQVGRCFMEHLFFDDVASYTPAVGLPPLRLYGRRSLVGGARIKATLAPTAALLAEAGIHNLCFKLASPIKRHPALLAAFALHNSLMTGRGAGGRQTSAREIVARSPALAAALLRLAHEGEYGRPERPRALPVTVVSEQAPNDASRVTLSDRRDALGQFRAQLDWRLAEIDRIGWRRGLALLARELKSRNLARIDLPAPEASDRHVDRLRGGCHHMGTTRMADDPAQGVVDRDGQVHDVAGLYIAGSSVFPTSGHANPTLTIIALALRLADRLKAMRLKQAR